MDLYDTARVRHPRTPVEHRLGTVTDITYAPYSTYVRRYQLQFPTGEERTYQAAEVVACTRDDDRAALVTAVTDAGRALRDACRTAHDYDHELSTKVVDLLIRLQATASAHLDITLDPATLPTSAITETPQHGARP
jgi:hypothetical protein